MAYSVIITLTDVGSAVGPFDLYSDVDNYATPFESNIPTSAFTYGYYTTLVPNNTLTIKVQSQGECLNFILAVVQNLPTSTVTPTVTSTPTSTIPVTPSPTATIGLTPTATTTLSATPTVTSTPTQTIGLTPTQTPTMTSTPTLSPTPNVTPTPSTTTPGGTLYVYARYVNTSQEFGYTLNGGSYIAIGQPGSMACTYVHSITGLVNGDEIDFVTLLTCGINGDTADCPNSTTGCVYTHTFVGTTYVYITVDGSVCC
jgi:hypothetical protein